MSPWEFAPTAQQQLEWPKWGQYFETKGQAGEPPDLPAAERLLELYEAWLGAADAAERAQIWHEMLRIWADEVYSIGLIAGVPQPVVVSTRLRNVPEEGMYNWDPGAHFGMYKPDTFWFDDTPGPGRLGNARPAAGIGADFDDSTQVVRPRRKPGLILASRERIGGSRLAPGLRF